MMNTPLRLVAAMAGMTMIVLGGARDPQTGGPGHADAAATSPDSSGATKVVATPSFTDQPIAAYQGDLLDLAFDAASAIPVNPHVKERSRAQDQVVSACLQLNQPTRAYHDLRRIEDWRVGTAYADLALYCAQHGPADEVEKLLDRANAAAETAEEWRRDRIRVHIAKAYAQLGQHQRAQEYGSNIVDSEMGPIEAIKAGQLTDAGFDEHVKVLDEMIATGNFDATHNALAAFAELFDHFYADQVRRTAAETRIKTAGEHLPLGIRLEFMFDIINTALEHRDKTKAYELVIDTRLMVDESPWMPENLIPVRARLAGLRHLAGDARNARVEIDAAIAMYDHEREQILSTDRVSTMLPLAEALQTMGDTTGALVMYQRLIEEGAKNPNARPRALDLSAECCSMAVHNVEPDSTLFARIREIRQGLVNPW